MFIALLCSFDYMPNSNSYAVNGRAYLTGHESVIVFNTKEAATEFAENYGVKWECFDNNFNHYMWYTKYVVIEAAKPKD